jgi:phospholipid/cholesterol/gamma-HCH transport system substrate-binding protein
MAMAHTHHLRVGAFAAIAIGLAGLVLIAFGGLALHDTSQRYSVVFNDSVYGLDPGADVYLNGVKVGTVEKIAVGDDIRQVVVTLKLNNATPVRTDTHALLTFAGITGLKIIDLRDGTPASPPLAPGSRIAVGAGLLDKLETQAQTIADQSTALLTRANKLTDNLVTVTADLGKITEPAVRAANNMVKVSESLGAMVDENRAALRGTLAEVQKAAGSTSQLMDTQVPQLVGRAGDIIGELKALLTSSEGPLRAAVFDLRQASRSFKDFARDVRQKPSRLLFSSDPEERKLP